MAIVSSYPQGTPTLNDTVIGTQYVENKEPVTKQFNINDIVDLVPVVYTQLPYKVFTALLTQSGGFDIQYLGSGELTIGVTYTIGFSTPGGDTGDFLNVGAPNNNIGTSFIATGTIPNAWGADSSLSYNTGAPVATVLENAIGNVWFSYDSDGLYNIESLGLFNNVLILYGTLIIGGGAVFKGYDNNSNTSSKIQINTIINGVNISTNDALLNTPIEIRVYN